MIGLLAQAVDQYGGNVTELPNTGFPLVWVFAIGILALFVGLLVSK